MKREVNVWDYAGKILEVMDKGILMTTAAGGEQNTMVIGWGHLGIIWGKPTFCAYVRESRHTKKLVDANREFTINVPLGAVDKNIIAVCGTKSGRDMDKFKELGLETEPGMTVSVPGIRQLPLTLECKVLYQQDQESSAIDSACLQRYYTPGTRNGTDFHTVYIGEITAAYIIE
jgi:flavin reductase (DIM6/NTAB) family NADH-FMN oxidoreductase RutF